MWRLVLILCLTFAGSGCSLIPEVVHQPVVHNPFPQLTRVAVVPFFNLSAEQNADGRQFALAYYNELQSIQGFEVVSLGVTEQTIKQYHLEMTNAGDARKLAQLLGVDAVVIGAVTDYSPYYPPRCAMTVEWYAANPGFHPIPPGYGLPWGTPEEEFIPAPLVYEAEHALARAQMDKAATPTGCPPLPADPFETPTPQQPELLPDADPLAQPTDDEAPAAYNAGASDAGKTIAAKGKASGGKASPNGTKRNSSAKNSLRKVQHSEEIPAPQQGPQQGPPADWPDARAFIPVPPCVEKPACLPSNEPVMRHTQIFNGNDGEFTTALANYVFFQDDARKGGWQAYLQRSDDFIRFCCRLHLYEMLSARGGAGESRVVWRWPMDR